MKENKKLTFSQRISNIAKRDRLSASWIVSFLVGLVVFPILLVGLCMTTDAWFDSIRADEHMGLMVLAAAVLSGFVVPTIMAFTPIKNNVIQAKKPAPAAPVQKAPTQKKSSGQTQKSKEQPKPKTTTRPNSNLQPKPGQKNDQCENTTTINVQAVKKDVTTFADIAGYAETKKNMEFIVRCLQHPEKLRAVGGKIPNGILLYGPPGTGKTLMAKAIAGTAGVKFYSANASEFVNIWVGQGAQNVRTLYQEAKQNAPSIVFIDEIDAIGGTRTTGQNQEYRQTLNALLTEIDGMNKDSGVLTIAATNAFEDLDPALVRPGRFDRKIAIPLPNYDDRMEIINLYAKKRRLASDISLENMAKQTVGMSGSGIATLFNEASIRAVMAGRSIIFAKDIDEAMTQMLTNGETSSKAARKEDLRVIAYHEAGHAILARLVAKDPVQKVSIIGNTAGAAGFTIRGGDDRQLLQIETLRGRAVMCYGGRAAEEIVFGKEHITTGSSQDLKDASKYIRAYLEAGAGSTLLIESSFAGQRIAPDTKEAKDLALRLYDEALAVLNEHRDALDRVANALIARETLMEHDLEVLL